MMINICLSLAYLISMLEVSNTIYNTICNYIADHPCKDAFPALLLTSISCVLVIFVVSNLSYFDYLNYREFLTTSSQLQ